ncbi:TIGR00255 family protein [Arachidicoccus rhizosphaerae]|uniref:TIGR00255 family protein n=1 Tax=Arachidicoccus rhizosphaerae TaxID=551991 RepID=A0A1H3WL95_9BACT|nr:YicC/YloC family endoribonuclease [Arachidicoccus rhizosphaerae]SDZ87917.1 TIGR00255 family protein [Arachidicoccus rhizosphaerae]
MLLSMTGYGRWEQLIGDKTFLVEIKSLNGKQYDIRLNLPVLLKPFEFKIRNLIADQLIRGSVECTVTIKQNGAGKSVALNADLAKHFYISVERLARELNASTEHLLGAVLKLPEVISNSTEVLTEEEYLDFEGILQNALDGIVKHREDEGAALEKDLLLRINNIESFQPQIAEKEVNRRVKIKEHLTKILEDHVGKDSYDANRLEQELVYYIEKIDISEEQVRLKTHCAYFKEILNEPGKSKGKKLGFVLQEIGREINTTGSKAYDLDIQRFVVQMKDELEKAKEQILNVL